MMGMGDINVEMMSKNPMRQESLVAAHNLLRELEANDSLTDDMKRILADLDSKLSAMELNLERSTSGSGEMLKEQELKDAKEKLKSAQDKILVWESNHDMIWESGPEKGSDYIEAVEDVVCLTELFRSLGVDKSGENKIIAEAEDVLQAAMARLEEELVHILAHRRQSYSQSEVDEAMTVGAGCGSRGDETDVVKFDLIEPEAVSFLKLVRKTMFDAKYDQEFCSAYVKTQKEALEDCLIGLGMETVSIDELVKMDWNIMASKIKTWIQVIRTGVKVYFLAEKRLCDEVIGKSEEPPASVCLTNITKSSMSCLFNFGHAMSLGPHTPEKLFYILDMYEVLAEVKEYINALFSDEGGLYVKTEFQQVMERLGDSARTTFLGFGDVILSDPTTDPFPGGGVHPLSSYVMNYIIVYLPDYCKTLDTLLQQKEEEGDKTVSAAPEKSLLASHLRAIAANLKSNLEKKSQLYKDTALQHVFMMNNTHYIQQKVINSELQKIFGDEWIRTQIVSYQQHATSYVRSTWSSVVASLRDDGIPSGSGSGVKAILKEKIRVFSVAFEDVYRNQTGWFIRDEQLKEELRISISQKVILAYQSFIGRHSKYDIEKYVKYDSDDLENLLRDFFEGSQKSLSYRRR